MAAAPGQYELHFEDETHVETNPVLGQVWHRMGQQPVVPAAGTNRRLTVFGSTVLGGQGRIEVLTVRADSAGFLQYLDALDARHDAPGRTMILVLDNGSCHTSRLTRRALAARVAWLEVVYLSRYSPELNPKEREWRWLKRDHRSHLAPTLQDFVDGLVSGLGQLGGTRCEIVNLVPDWWLAGHRHEPTGRPPGRPKSAKAAQPSPSSRTNIPAPT